MNDTTINTQGQSPSNGGMNTMMIVGAVVVLAIIGFFVVKSTSSQPTQKATSTETNSTTTPSDAMMDSDGDADDTMMAPEDTTADTTMMASDSTMMNDITGDTSQTQVVNIEGGSFYYKPNTIKVKKGQKVKVVMKSMDMMHDFVIDELKVKMPIVKSGDTGTVEFVADKVGEFEFYCSVGQHRANGMVGTLIVTE